MTYSFEVQIEPRMLRRAWNAWCFADGRGWRMLIAATAFVVFGIFQKGPADTLSIGIVAVGCIAFLIYGIFYLLGLRRATSKSEALIDGKARYTLTEATIEATSAMGSLSLAWSALAEVRRYRDLVLLGFRGALYSPLPAAQVPAEALAFLMERARHAGAKISG
jgi:hypothetical protein